jgi:Arc/MetJ-type ribon-helix-helix transcriptional regulator
MKPKTNVVSLRIPPQERDEIARAVRAKRTSRSQFIRQAIRAALTEKAAQHA